LLRPALTVLLLAALPALATPADTGQLDASPSLFTIMAAINAAGYKAEWSSPNNHPIRAAIQAELAKRNIPSLVPLKEFFESHRKRTDAQELSQYISFALLHRPALLRVRYPRRGNSTRCHRTARSFAPPGYLL
jgi:hypothetical protein